MLTLLTASDENLITIVFAVVGVIMIFSVIVGLVRIIRSPRGKSGGSYGQTSWGKRAEEYAQTMTADELYGLAKSHIDGKIPDADFVLGEAIMKKAAEKGSGQAEFYMGTKCDFGETLQAVEWFKKAAAHGVDEAYEKLGNIYNYGRDYGDSTISPNYKEAEKWYLPLAEKGNVEVMKVLALMYSLDLNDEESSLKWYKKAAETGDMEAIKQVATHYDIEDDYDNAIIWCKKAAEAGDAESMCDLARLYENSEPADMANAVFWYKKAAENGDGNAKVNLALLYLDGDGVEKDVEKGLEMLKTEAENGNSRAKFRLGLCYEKGEVVQKDLKKAFEFYNASQNYYASKCRLALFYLSGEVVKKDQKKAFEILSGEEENCFDEEILFKLGECYFYGWGTEKDKERARGLWRKAAKYGSDEAAEALDRLFGEKVETDD